MKKIVFVLVFFSCCLFSQEQINENVQSKIDNLIQLIKKTDFKKIKPKDTDEFKTIVETLSGMGKAAVPALTKTLSDKNLQVRIFALGVLRKISEKEPLDISLFDRFLYDKNSNMRMIAAVSLGHMKDSGLPSLEKAIASTNKDVVASALIGLRHIGEKALPILTNKIKDDDEDISLAALQSLFFIAKESKVAVTVLATALKSKNLLVRQMAISYLEKLGENADVVIPEIIDASYGLFMEATALKILRNLGEKVLPELIVALKSKDRTRQFVAQNILRHLKEKAVPALPAILEMFKEKETRDVAAQCLKKMEEHAASITPQLTDMLTNKELRLDVISILGDIGEKAGDAIPAILKIHQENPNNWSLNYTVERALANMGEASIPHILQIFESEHPHVKKLAISVCKDLGPKALPMLPHLIKALEDSENNHTAAEALGKIGASASSAVPKLMVLLKTKSYARRYAIQALNEIGETSEEFMVALVEIVKQENRNNESLKVLASMPLEKIGNKVDPIIPALLNMVGLYTKEGGYARKILEKIGQRCIPDLIARMKQKDLFSFAMILEKIEEAVPFLIETVKNKDNDLNIRIGAVSALRSREAAIQVLIDTLNNQEENSRLRIFAANTLRTLGNKAEVAVPALLSAIREAGSRSKMGGQNEGSLKSNALKALGEVSPNIEIYVDELMSALKDDDLYLKEAAMMAISNSEKPIPEAIPLIIEALYHKHWSVSYIAQEALMRMNKKNPNPKITEALKKKKDSSIRRGWGSKK